MSNREQLNTIRATLQDLDAQLREIEPAVPSRNAATHLGRARAMLRASEQLIATALRNHVDGLPDAADPARIPSIEQVRDAIAAVEPSICSISPGAMRLRLCCADIAECNAAMTRGMEAAGWSLNRFGCFQRPSEVAA